MRISVFFVCLLFLFQNLNAQKPTVVWAKTAGGSGNDAGYITSTDQDGNVFVAGKSFSSTFSFNSSTLINSYTSHPTSYLAKYNSKGELIWVKGGGSGNSYSLNAIINDKSGNTYIGGSFASDYLTLGKFTLSNNLPYINGKLFFAKYSPEGEVLWALKPETNISCDMFGLGIDDSGNLYTTGHFQDNTMKFGNVQVTNSLSPYQDFFLIKFDSNGNAITGKKFGGNGYDVGRAIKTDKNGNSFISGTYKSERMTIGTYELTNTANNLKAYDDPSTTTNIFLTKLNTNGDVIWAKSAGNEGNDYNRSVAIDPNGNSFICGSFQSSTIIFGSKTLTNTNISNTKSYLTKYDPSGNVLWALSSDQSSGSDEFYGVDTDINGNVYVCGSFSGQTIKYDTITLRNTNTSGRDIIVLKYNPLGKIVWAKNFGNSNDENGFSCSVDKDRNVYIAGDFKSGTVKFDEIQAINKSSGSSDIFLAKIKQIVDTLSIKYCSEDTTITITAPHGYVSYKWTYNSVTKITTDSILIIKNPGVGTIITCEISVADGSTFTTIPKAVIDYILKSDFNYTITNCKTNTVEFTDNSESSHNPVTYKWTFGDGTTSTDKNPTHTFTIGGKNRVILEISNPLSSCTDTISKIVQFCNSEETEWDFTLTGQTSFCEGDTVLLEVEGGVSYVWSNGETTDMLYVTEPGVYEVTATNENCCSKTKRIVITENKKPQSDFEMSNTKIDILNNKIYFTITSESNVQYQWDLGDGSNETENSFEHTFNATNSFKDYLITLTATNNFGCSSTTTKTIQVIPFVPNVFTPNKDGVNELFMPGIELFIYDRYGKTIYKGNSGWDGTYNGKDMPSDTYFYYLTYTDKNQINQSLKGYLTLLR